MRYYYKRENVERVRLGLLILRNIIFVRDRDGSVVIFEELISFGNTRVCFKGGYTLFQNVPNPFLGGTFPWPLQTVAPSSAII
jgi:hypothetical protein